MAQADSTGARKRSTWKTKSTKDEEAFLYDFSLPSVPLSSALDPKVPRDTLESHKSGALLGVAQTLTPQHPFSSDSASPDYLTQKISLVQAECKKLALELELLRLKREQPPPATPQSNQGSTAPASTTRKKHTVDWPQDFTQGTSTNLDYDKLELAEFVAGYLAMIKTYDPATTKLMLCHLELLMIKGTSYTWSSVRSFHAHIAKQVELYRLEWSNTSEIRDRANTFFKHSDLRQAPPPRVSSTPALTSRGKQDAGQDNHGCKPWNYTGSSSQHKCRICQQDHPMLHCPKRRNPIPSTF